MYDHIGLKVKSLDASVRFYTAALAPLGYVLSSRDDSGAGFFMHMTDLPPKARTSRSAPPITPRSRNFTARA